MHIAAAKPKALDETGVDQAQIAAERRIAIEKAREAGKPEAMLERIAEGTVKKFLKEVTLVNQPFVKDDKKSVGRTREGCRRPDRRLHALRRRRRHRKAR